MPVKAFDLSGRVAVIIGHNQSWTKTFIKALAQSGADVVAVGNGFTEMDDVIEEVRGVVHKGIALSTDITKSEDIKNTVEIIVSRFGKIDILINNAIVEFVKPFNDSTENEWRNMINNNLIGMMLWCHMVGKYMVEWRAGKIINIISGLSVRGLPNHTIYCATMGAIHQFTKALALEWARQNVKVNAIAYGHMSKGRNNEEVISDRLVRHIPLRRLGNSDDLAAPLVYLSSDASDYISGETLFVDGGLISHG